MDLDLTVPGGRLVSPYFNSPGLFHIREHLARNARLQGRLSIEILTLKIFDHLTWNLEGTNQPFAELLLRIDQDRPAVIGFSGYVWNIDSILVLARKLREVAPDTLFVLGGPEAYGRERLAARGAPIDCIIEGAGEHPFETIVTRLLEGNREFGDLPNVSFLNEAGVWIHGPPDRRQAGRPGGQPSLRHPSYRDLMFGTAFVIVSSGCNNRCSYCLWNAMPRTEGDSSMAAEDVAALAASPAVGEILLFDSSFETGCPTDNRVLRRLIDEYPRRQSPLLIGMFASLRDLRQPEMLSIFREDAIQYIAIGIQSISQQTLAAIGRLDTLDDIAGFPELDRRLLDKCVAQLMYPLPAGTYAGLLDSLRWCFSKGLFNVEMLHLMVFAGTRMYLQRQRFGIVSLESSPYYCLETSTFTGREVQRALRLATVVNELTVKVGIEYGTGLLARVHAMLQDDRLDMVDLIERYIDAAPADRPVGLSGFVNYLEDLDLLSGELADELRNVSLATPTHSARPAVPLVEPMPAGSRQAIHPEGRPGVAQRGGPETATQPVDRTPPALERAGQPLLLNAAPVCLLALRQLGAGVSVPLFETGAVVFECALPGGTFPLVLRPADWQGETFATTRLFAVEYRGECPNVEFVRRFVRLLPRLEPLIERLLQQPADAGM